MKLRIPLVALAGLLYCTTSLGAQHPALVNPTIYLCSPDAEGECSGIHDMSLSRKLLSQSLNAYPQLSVLI